jgi:hypothetical protein
MLEHSHTYTSASNATLFSSYSSSLLHALAINGHHHANGHSAKIATLYFHCSLMKSKYATVLPFVIIYSLRDICLRVLLVFMFTRIVFFLQNQHFAYYLVSCNVVQLFSTMDSYPLMAIYD